MIQTENFIYFRRILFMCVCFKLHSKKENYKLKLNLKFMRTMKANFETIFETKDRKAVSVQIGKNCVNNIQFVSILFVPWPSISEERSQQEQDWPRVHEILNDHQLDVIKGLIHSKFAVKFGKRSSELFVTQHN